MTKIPSEGGQRAGRRERGGAVGEGGVQLETGSIRTMEVATKINGKLIPDLLSALSDSGFN